jgi:hypothetical protein
MLLEQLRVAKLANIVKQVNTMANTQPVRTPTHPTPQPTPTPLPTVLLQALPSLHSPTETALPMFVVNFPVPNDEEQELHDVMHVIEREQTEREEAESENGSIEDTVPTFVSMKNKKQGGSSWDLTRQSLNPS